MHDNHWALVVIRIDKSFPHTDLYHFNSLLYKDDLANTYYYSPMTLLACRLKSKLNALKVID